MKGVYQLFKIYMLKERVWYITQKSNKVLGGTSTCVVVIHFICTYEISMGAHWAINVWDEIEPIEKICQNEAILL